LSAVVHGNAALKYTTDVLQQWGRPDHEARNGNFGGDNGFDCDYYG